jgi:hypothetical protein
MMITMCLIFSCASVKGSSGVGEAVGTGGTVGVDDGFGVAVAGITVGVEVETEPVRALQASKIKTDTARSEYLIHLLMDVYLASKS